MYRIGKLSVGGVNPWKNLDKISFDSSKELHLENKTWLEGAIS